jgi:hypothetical protein
MLSNDLRGKKEDGGGKKKKEGRRKRVNAYLNKLH